MQTQAGHEQQELEGGNGIGGEGAGAGGKEARKGCRGRCFRSTISIPMVKLETRGQERHQMRLEWT